MLHWVGAGTLVHSRAARGHRDFKTAGLLIKSDLTGGSGPRCYRRSPHRVAKQSHGLFLRSEGYGDGKTVPVLDDGGDALPTVRDELAVITEERHSRGRHRSQHKISRSVRCKIEGERFRRR